MSGAIIPTTQSGVLLHPHQPGVVTRHWPPRGSAGREPFNVHARDGPISLAGSFVLSLLSSLMAMCYRIPFPLSSSPVSLAPLFRQHSLWWHPRSSSRLKATKLTRHTTAHTHTRTHSGSPFWVGGMCGVGVLGVFNSGQPAAFRHTTNTSQFGMLPSPRSRSSLQSRY